MNLQKQLFNDNFIKNYSVLKRLKILTLLEGALNLHRVGRLYLFMALLFEKELYEYDY